MTDDVLAFIGAGRTIETLACDDIVVMAQAVLGEFWAEYPEHRTTDDAEALEQLNTMAKVAGFENVERFVGSATIHGDGRMVLELSANE